MQKKMKYKIKDKILICSHCGSKDFESGEAQLNTALMTFFKLDWLNKNATIYFCKECGKIEWFISATGVEDVSSETECLACGTIIQAEETKCPACGWSYK
jgi:predicted nucleic-acid-binding Zn-ribbon protein